jgi:uncharacterized membrane protein
LVSELATKSLDWFGFDLGQNIFQLVRFAGLLISAVYVAKLALNKNEISGTRKAGLALACMILLSPVVFPWYFLWPLALFAASGLKSKLAMQISVYGTLLVVAYSIVEAVAVRDSAITSPEILFSLLVVVSIFSVMKFKENREIFDLEQMHVS